MSEREFVVVLAEGNSLSKIQPEFAKVGVRIVDSAVKTDKVFVVKGEAENINRVLGTRGGYMLNQLNLNDVG